MTFDATFLATFNHNMAAITLVGFVVFIVWAVVLALYKGGVARFTPTHLEKVTTMLLPFGFFVTLAAMLCSLFYSEVLHVLPCDLCWFQRIFIYSLVFIFGMAWYKKDTRIFDYIFMLSGVGFLIAMYHHYLQLGYNLYAPCSTALFAVDCSRPTFVEFGFITFPFMSAVTLGVAFLVALTGKMLKK